MELSHDVELSQFIRFCNLSKTNNRAAVEEKRKSLRDGTLQIWKGPLVTVDDRELLPSGKVGDDRFLEGLMTYVKGVEGQVPAGR